jgi:hypothetical protein
MKGLEHAGSPPRLVRRSVPELHVELDVGPAELHAGLGEVVLGVPYRCHAGTWAWLYQQAAPSESAAAFGRRTRGRQVALGQAMQERVSTSTDYAGAATLGARWR